jgi:cytochrome c
MIVAFSAACSSPDGAPQRVAPGLNANSAADRPATPSEWPAEYALGQPARADWIAYLDTDVDTTGAGLPGGHGTAAEGAGVFMAKCASCHGARGEGIANAPVLIQPLIPTDSFPWAGNPGAPKTVGNYWPFATTLYGYVRHSMPQTAPGSLTPNEVYEVVAYLLAENGVLARETVLDAQSLPKVKLPMRSRLVLDTRKGGAEVR